MLSFIIAIHYGYYMLLLATIKPFNIPVLPKGWMNVPVAQRGFTIELLQTTFEASAAERAARLARPVEMLGIGNGSQLATQKRLTNVRH